MSNEKPLLSLWLGREFLYQRPITPAAWREVSVLLQLVQITMGEQLLIITINMAVTSVQVPIGENVTSHRYLSLILSPTNFFDFIF